MANIQWFNLGEGIAYIVESGDGWVKYSNGKMEQHFVVEGTRGQVTPHSFPEPFKSGTEPICHRTINIGTSGNAQQLRGWNVDVVSNTSFNIYTTDISGSNISMISAYGDWE